MIRTAALLRGALATLVGVSALVDAEGYVVGREAVAMAPVLVPYRTPLYLALALGALLVLAGVAVALDLSGHVRRVEAFSDRGLALLRRLRVLSGVVAGYLLVCVVGMQHILDRWNLDMPGVWLAAFVGELALLATVGLISYLISTQTPGYVLPRRGQGAGAAALMLLTGAGGTEVELRVTDYQFADASHANPTQDWDANWLIVAGRVRLPDGTSWSFADPSLTTWEVRELVAWLRRAADAQVPVAETIRQDRNVATAAATDAYWEIEAADSGWLTFTEPNLCYAVTRYAAGHVELLIGLGWESAPPPVEPMGPRWIPVAVTLSVERVVSAAIALEAELSRHPVRGPAE